MGEINAHLEIMKKLLLVIPIVVLLAAGCNSSTQTTPAPATSQAMATSLAKCTSEQYNSSQQTNCFTQYGAAAKDMNACKTIGVYPSDVDCAIGVAVAMNNPNLCGQVSGFTSFEAPQYGVEGCQVGFAVAKKNCEALPFLQTSNNNSDELRNECYSGVAQNILDDSYCAKISSPYDEDACYQSLGEVKNDTTVCDKMVDFNLKDEFKGDCYMKVAQNTKNSSICDEITFVPGDIATCYELLGLKPPVNAPATANPSAGATLNQKPNIGSSITFTLDKGEATASPNQLVQFTGKIVNTTNREIYLNGINSNLSYSELTADTSPFFKLPTTLKVGESASGVIFSVATSQIALPGDYTGSIDIEGGADQSTQGVLGDQTFVIHVIK
jgi:hypothetical protein